MVPNVYAEKMADVDFPPGIEPPDVPSAPDQPVEEVSSAGSEQALTGDQPTEEQPKKKNLYNDEYDLDEDNPLAGSDDEEEDIVVTIGKIEPINVQFSLKHNTHERTYASKLDVDAVPAINDQPIYDVDLASMEDRPWRKPGADITDYFNYGFTEETWNTYCERQKKLRTEFTSQAAVNKALFSNIYLANPLGMPAVTNRSTGAITDTTSNVKVLTDNGGRFKVHHHNKDEPVMRTVIGAPPPTTPTSAPPPTIDFSRPPPGMSMPPPTVPPVLGAPPATDGGEAPPGVNPPGIDGPPGVEMTGQSSIPTVGSGPPMDMSMPPPGFNPSLPPPGMSVRPPPIGIPTVTIGPPGFNTMLPPPGYNQMRYPMNHGTAGMGRPPPLMGRDYEGRRDGGDMDDDGGRRRRRSRSRSPRRGDRDGRRRDERDDRRDRERDRKDRDRDRSERSRRHRSRSREDKRRDRRDDDDRKRRRDRDEEDDRKDRRDRRKKDDRSPDKEDRSPNDEEVAGEQ